MSAPLWRKVERADDQPFISRAVCRVSRLYVKEPVYWFESGRDLLQDNCSKVSALCNLLLTERGGTKSIQPGQMHLTDGVGMVTHIAEYFLISPLH